MSLKKKKEREPTIITVAITSDIYLSVKPLPEMREYFLQHT